MPPDGHNVAGSDAAPSWGQLYRRAEAQAGYVTTAQANAAGYSNPLLHYHVREGRLERVERGIYRLVHFPPGQQEDLVVWWLWSSRQGVYGNETALALHELSDALPVRAHLTVPRAWKSRRLRVPPQVELSYADVGEEERVWIGAVPATSALRTVVDCARGGVDPGLVKQAISEGLARGLFQRAELRRLLEAAELSQFLPRTRRSRG